MTLIVFKIVIVFTSATLVGKMAIITVTNMTIRNTFIITSQMVTGGASLASMFISTAGTAR